MIRTVKKIEDVRQNDEELSVAWEDNESVEALKEMVSEELTQLLGEGNVSLSIRIDE